MNAQAEKEMSLGVAVENQNFCNSCVLLGGV